MSESGSPRLLLPSIGAVLAGFAATFVLSIGTDAALHLAGVFPALGQPMSDALFALATAYRTVYTVAGGWVTARLAPSRPMRHVLALGAIGLVAATAGAAVTWNRPELGPHWYPVALVVLALPSVWAGGWLQERRSPDCGVRVAVPPVP